MRVAIIDQSQFAAQVLVQLKTLGHTICGVFTIEDKNGREDALAVIAKQQNVPLFKIKRWRLKGVLEQDVFQVYQGTQPDLNVLPYCSQFIPMEVIEYPKHQSIVYHPSILPKHRGASAINWTLIEGDLEAGLTVFWADNGLDTGPILLQRKVKVTLQDTVDSLYGRFLYPEGIRAVVDSVQLITAGCAPRTAQSAEGASYDAMLNKLELQQLPLQAKKMTGLEIHNFIRGLDKVPGAWINIEGSPYRLYGSKLMLDKHFYVQLNAYPAGYKQELIFGRPINLQGQYQQSYVTQQGLAVFGADGQAVLISRIKCMASNRMMLASKLGATNLPQPLELTEEEAKLAEKIRAVFAAVLRLDSPAMVDDQLNFFDAGASSMDVTRLVEELKELLGCPVENDDVYLEPEFGELLQMLVRRVRDGDTSEQVKQIEYDGVSLSARGSKICVPTQPFINGEFVDVVPSNVDELLAASAADELDEQQKRKLLLDNVRKLKLINPANEQLLCEVQQAGKFEVDRAVFAARAAFESNWSLISARDRGRLLHRLADLMDAAREQLAALESLDSGAVYTLALKTHVGMSIDVIRYMAGWTDKIQGKTIPISHNRPSRDLCITRREPFGVCALITPWNYPLMMVAWKVSAALAAGNCVIIKPPAVCPLTVLKLAELVAQAGFPPGVFNIVPGAGSEIGRALSQHPLVSKLAFTGSTDVGKQIMADCSTPWLKKVSLELGGKSPLCIFDDCDIDKAVRNAIQAVFFNKGENCIAAGRIFIQVSIHDEFVRRLVAETAKMTIGDPLERGTAHGPQNHEAHLKKLLNYVQKGIEEGAKLEFGGKRVDRPGYYLQPTIFSGVKDGTLLATEESFGPIMCISTFTGDIDEVLARCNNSDYGLAAGVFTQDISKALQFAERIQGGTCFINCYNKTDVAAPFGGFKQSGYGKDLGEEALNEYLKTKTITIEY